MTEFIAWSIRLFLVDYRRRVRDRITWFAVRMTWDGGRFARFVDWLSPWRGPFGGYKRRQLRRWLYIARYPITQLRFQSLLIVDWVLVRITPYTGPGRYEVLDPRNRLKAEWLDSNSELADQSVGDLTIYPLFNSLFANLDVPWSRRPESWIMERDEMGFVVVLQYENETEAQIAFDGAEYRFDQAHEADLAGDREDEDDDGGYAAAMDREFLLNREGDPHFNGAFG
jgi:hypothetical protein